MAGGKWLLAAIPAGATAVGAGVGAAAKGKTGALVGGGVGLLLGGATVWLLIEAALSYK